jgi:hypothetical protein
MNLNLFNKEEKEPENFMYTEDQLMARLKFFIGICLALTLFGIVFVVLYSLIFVTQPLNAMSPIDQKFFELIIPIATFLTGTLSGIMLAGGDKDAQKQALTAANKGWDKQSTPIAPAPISSFGGNTPQFTGSFGGNTNQFTGSFGGNTNQFTGSTTSTGTFNPQVVTGFGGKPMPMQPPQPEL